MDLIKTLDELYEKQEQDYLNFVNDKSKTYTIDKYQDREIELLEQYLKGKQNE